MWRIGDAGRSRFGRAFAVQPKRCHGRPRGRGFTFLGRDSAGVSVKLDDGEIIKARVRSRGGRGFQGLVGQGSDDTMYSIPRPSKRTESDWVASTDTSHLYPRARQHQLMSLKCLEAFTPFYTYR